MYLMKQLFRAWRESTHSPPSPTVVYAGRGWKVLGPNVTQP
jgi:hypothetical protein